MRRQVVFAVVLAALSGATQAGAEGTAASQARPTASPAALVRVSNPISIQRPAETISLGAAPLRQRLGEVDLRRVRVRDESGRDLLVQPIDLDQDGGVDELIFQADLAPNARRDFTVTVGERQAPRREDFKAYGRFVRERYDDFAWENDRVAFRMYGAALERAPREPLTSSGIDVWSKRTSRLVINDWYLLDNYHQDHGEGGDFYSAGTSRGCGGSGIWANGTLYASSNFRQSRVLANGPIRVVFEVAYEPWRAGDARVSEVKRVTLDAGHNLNRIESRYTIDGPVTGLEHAIGIRVASESAVTADPVAGVLRTWEPVKMASGHLGCGVIVDGMKVLSTDPSAAVNALVAAKIPASLVASYDAGFAWDITGQVPGGMAGWDRYLADAAARRRSPVTVTWLAGEAR